MASGHLSAASSLGASVLPSFLVWETAGLCSSGTAARKVGNFWLRFPRENAAGGYKCGHGRKKQGELHQRWHVGVVHRPDTTQIKDTAIKAYAKAPAAHKYSTQSAALPSDAPRCVRTRKSGLIAAKPAPVPLP